MNNKKHKDDTLEAISDAIKAIRDDIAADTDQDKNKTRAEAILALSVAYSIIK